eukprot:COSAG02_NODE_4104_length_5771_cov_9.131005_4_plen_97_part_00
MAAAYWQIDRDGGGRVAAGGAAAGQAGAGHQWRVDWARVEGWGRTRDGVVDALGPGGGASWRRVDARGVGSGGGPCGSRVVGPEKPPAGAVVGCRV